MRPGIVDKKVPAPAPDQLSLALERTFLAYERTLMAWIRTSTSLITFGFTLFKFFMYLHEQDPIKYPQQLLGARTFGLLMIGVGLLMLVLATWQHRQQTKYLQTYFANAPFSLSLVLAGLIGGLGVLGLIASIFQP